MKKRASKMRSMTWSFIYFLAPYLLERLHDIHSSLLLQLLAVRALRGGDLLVAGHGVVDVLEREVGGPEENAGRSVFLLLAVRHAALEGVFSVAATFGHSDINLQALRLTCDDRVARVSEDVEVDENNK